MSDRTGAVEATAEWRAIIDSLRVCAVNAGDEHFEKHGMRFTIRPTEAKALLEAVSQPEQREPDAWAVERRIDEREGWTLYGSIVPHPYYAEDLAGRIRKHGHDARVVAFAKLDTPPVSQQAPQCSWCGIEPQASTLGAACIRRIQDEGRERFLAGDEPSWSWEGYSAAERQFQAIIEQETPQSAATTIARIVASTYHSGPVSQQAPGSIEEQTLRYVAEQYVKYAVGCGEWRSRFEAALRTGVSAPEVGENAEAAAAGVEPDAATGQTIPMAEASPTRGVSAQPERPTANADLIARMECVAIRYCDPSRVEEMAAEMQPLVASAQPERSEPSCGNCHRCLAGVVENGFPVTSQRMILCPDCGNKRCPKASDCRLACTGSNEPGQQGSVYEAWPDVLRASQPERVQQESEQ